MPTDPVFDNIVLEKKTAEIKTVVKAETETDTPAENVAKVLSLSAWAVVSEHKKTDNALSFSGKVVYYMCYKDAEGNIRKSERAGAFSGEMPAEKLSDSDYPQFTCAVDKTDWTTDGSAFKVAAYIAVNAKIHAVCEETFLSGGDGLILNRTDAEYDKSFGVRKTAFSVDEEFDLNYPVTEVLLQSVKSRITAVQCGVGTVIADGEVFLSILCLQKTEDGGIIREDKVISFRAELEYEDAMPTMSATANVFTSSYKTEVSVDAENGKSTVSFTAGLTIEGEAFSKESFSFSDDVFSATEELDVISCEKSVVCDRGTGYSSQRVIGRADGDGLPENYTISAACCEKIEITSFTADSGTVRAEGVLSAVLYIEEDGKITARKKETPVAFSFGCDIVGGANAELTAFAVNCSAKESGGGVELCADIISRIDYITEKKIKFIKEVKTIGEKVPKNAAISVYIPVRGENLWSLAKRLSVCPDELVATNKDLQFPLTGDERIVVYRQK